MGTPAFAVPVLRSLAFGHQVVAVYTQPDRPAGRGRKTSPPPVKQVAESLGIEVRQPPTLRDPAVVAGLDDLAPDIICVAAYGLILPRDVLAIPRWGCVNVHASLLPRHRGAAPVHRAILEGDRVTGISIMHMEEGLDTGPYALQASVDVDDHTVDSLTDLLADMGAGALLEVLGQIESGTAQWVEQDESLANYAAKVTRHDVALDPGLTVSEAQRRVLASSGSAPSRACVAGRMVTVVRTSPSDEEIPQGRVRAGKRDLVLGFADGALSLDEIRPEGRSCMDGACFARGAHLGEASTWEACP